MADISKKTRATEWAALPIFLVPLADDAMPDTVRYLLLAFFGGAFLAAFFAGADFLAAGFLAVLA